MRLAAGRDSCHSQGQWNFFPPDVVSAHERFHMKLWSVAVRTALLSAGVFGLAYAFLDSPHDPATRVLLLFLGAGAVGGTACAVLFHLRPSWLGQAERRPLGPHPGPNMSRIRLEGAGGFIYALTPVIILILGAPLVLLAFVAAGAILAPLIHLQLRRRRTVTSLAGAVSSFLVLFGLFGLALPLGQHPAFQIIGAASIVGVAGGAVVAFLLHARASIGHGLSIQPCAGSNRGSA